MDLLHEKKAKSGQKGSFYAEKKPVKGGRRKKNVLRKVAPSERNTGRKKEECALKEPTHVLSVNPSNHRNKWANTTLQRRGVQNTDRNA